MVKKILQGRLSKGLYQKPFVNNSQFTKQPRATLPSLKDLGLIRNKIKTIRNRRGEFKRGIHYGCYLLCSQAGLRISEAVRFDLKAKTRKDLYRIEKPKGKKERLVYVSKEVIRELKENNWQPHQTNRYNFYHFLRKIKRELNISKNIEITPHNLRRAFATYHANSGMPLPLLQKLLGHSSIRTTALYWQNIYSDNDKGDDISDILAGKKWLENREKETPEPPTENFPKIAENLEPDITRDKPIISAKKLTKQDNSLLTAKAEPKPAKTLYQKGLPSFSKLGITNHQPKLLISKTPPSPPRKFISKKTEISKQLPVITKRKQPTEKEQFLLTRIKQLERELAKVQAENTNLKLENKHLKVLIRKEQETEAKVIQPPPFKGEK